MFEWKNILRLDPNINPKLDTLKITIDSLSSPKKSLGTHLKVHQHSVLNGLNHEDSTIK